MANDDIGELMNEGARLGLTEFRDELLESRGLIENAGGPVFDVIIDMLDKVIAEITNTTERANGS